MGKKEGKGKKRACMQASDITASPHIWDVNKGQQQK